MIKVLFTIPNFDTAGSGKALLNIAKGLDRSRFEPHILCRHDRGHFFKTVEESGIPVHVFEYTTAMRPVIKGLRECWSMSREFKKIDPDIVHSFHYAADYSEALAVKMAGCKWVYTKKNMSWGGSSKNAWLLRSFLADRIVVLNTKMGDQFFPNSRGKTSLIPRGVDTRVFSLQNTNGSGTNTKRTVVCVANLVPVKGVEVLIEAFRMICGRTRNSSWQLKIVGDDRNEYGVQLKQTYEELIRRQKLIFTGKIADVKAELEASEIFVLPTQMEGCPVSLLEAMSMGLIVVGSAVPGITDQLDSLGEDHLFEPGNISMLGEKLQKHMDTEPENRKLLNEKIRAYCRSEWDISIEIARHEKFYIELLGR
jgi:glycosyltransferase involved in cell wall biosynthesis